MTRMILAFGLMLAGCGSDKADDTSGGGDTDAGGEIDCEVDPLHWDCNEIEVFFLVYCTGCHSESPKDFTDYTDVYEWREKIRCGVTPGPESLAGCGSDPQPEQFPCGTGPFPEDYERDQIVDWIDAGAPR